MSLRAHGAQGVPATWGAAVSRSACPPSRICSHLNPRGRVPDTPLPRTHPSRLQLRPPALPDGEVILTGTECSAVPPLGFRGAPGGTGRGVFNVSCLKQPAHSRCSENWHWRKGWPPHSGGGPACRGTEVGERGVKGLGSLCSALPEVGCGVSRYQPGRGGMLTEGARVPGPVQASAALPPVPASRGPGVLQEGDPC